MQEEPVCILPAEGQLPAVFLSLPMGESQRSLDYRAWLSHIASKPRGHFATLFRRVFLAILRAERRALFQSSWRPSFLSTAGRGCRFFFFLSFRLSLRFKDSIAAAKTILRPSRQRPSQVLPLTSGESDKSCSGQSVAQPPPEG